MYTIYTSLDLIKKNYFYILLLVRSLALCQCPNVIVLKVLNTLHAWWDIVIPVCSKHPQISN